MKLRKISSHVWGSVPLCPPPQPTLSPPCVTDGVRTTGLDNKDATTPTAHVAQVRMRRAQVGEKTAEVGVEEAVTGTVGLQTQIPVPIPPTLGQE